MPIGLYIHVPFCKKKCPYCDFYSLPFSDELEKSYVKAVVRNIKSRKGIVLDSIYFGGGTPSILSIKAYEEIFSAINTNFSLENAEISLEANPSTVTLEKLIKLKKIGFNRISFGVQSCVDEELKKLGRLHDFQQAANAVINAKKAGFDDISCDLMLGIIGQTSQSLKYTIEKLTSLPITHISAYMLKIEASTAYNNADIINQLPDEDLVADMYLQAIEELSKQNFEQYEISNFSKQGFECKHNLKYWRCEEYLGIGPSSHSFLNGKRFAVKSNLNEFLDNDFQVVYITEENPKTFEEVAMLALRLNKGLPLWIAKDFQIDVDNILIKANTLEKHGLVIVSDDSIKITPKGFLISNSIISELIL